MTDNNGNVSRRNSKGPVNNDGPGAPRIEAPINGERSARADAMKERLERYAKIVAEQKKQMLDTNKDKLVDIIFKQNSLITQQSNQMVDMVNLVNDLNDQSSADTRSSGSTQSSRSSPVLQRNIDILRKRNELCQEADEMRQESAKLYSSSVKIQFVLFTLFILVLFWLLYHYISFEK
jgi:hypothetical protein